MLVLHLAAHVFDGVDGGLVVRQMSAAIRELLEPMTARLAQLVKDQPRELHRIDLCRGQK